MLCNCRVETITTSLSDMVMLLLCFVMNTVLTTVGPLSGCCRSQFYYVSH